MSLATPPLHMEGEVVIEHAAYEDAMVDIETLSLSPYNAVILSIGMIEFDPRAHEFKIGDRQLIIPNITEQLLLGREVTASTQKFWADQSGLAAAHWRDAQPGVPLNLMAAQVQAFLRARKRVWANGILFDLGNIDSLCRQAMKSDAPPWHYRAPRDMRDRVWDMPQLRDTPDLTEHTIIPHEPISDCIKQAADVWSHHGEAEGAI